MIEDTPLANITAIRQEAIIRVAVVGVDIIQGVVATSITNPIIIHITTGQEEDMMIEIKEDLSKRISSQII